MEAARLKQLEEKFSQPSRQNLVAIVFLLLSFVRGLVSRFWPLLIAFFIGSNRREGGFERWLAMVGLVVSAFSVIVSIISYFRLYYYVEDKDLVLEKGWLRKLKLTMPIDRIQSINFEQNILHRILNVVKVDIETAGSKDNELSLIALSRAKAEELRDFLLAEREEMREAMGEAGAEMGGENEEIRKSAHQHISKSILQLSVKDLFRSGLSENPFRGLVIILAVGGFLFGELSSVIGDEWLDSLVDSSGVELERSALSIFFLVATVVIPIMVVASWLLTFLLTVTTYFNLHFEETHQGYRLVHGIFQRKERSAQRSKIQFLVWSTQPLQQIFGMFRARLHLAGDESSRRSTIRLIGAYQQHIIALRESLFPGRDPATLSLQGIHPKAAFRRFLFRGIIPALALAGLLWGWASFLALIWLAIQLPLARRYQRRWRWGIDDEVIYTRTHVIAQNHKMLSLYKVQAVSINQGWYHRRHGLATLVLHTASGRTFNVPYIEIELAHHMRDYVMFRIESDDRPWM